MIGQQVIAYP